MALVGFIWELYGFSLLMRPNPTRLSFVQEVTEKEGKQKDGGKRILECFIPLGADHQSFLDRKIWMTQR